MLTARMLRYISLVCIY